MFFVDLQWFTANTGDDDDFACIPGSRLRLAGVLVVY